MSYQFSEAERAQILQAIGASTGLRLVQTPSGALRYEFVEDSAANTRPFYETLSSLLAAKISQPVGIDQATLADLRSTKLWLDVAIGANSGVGMHSTFIRTYTEAQVEFRLGRPVTDLEMQSASNAVARNFVNGLISGDSASNLAPSG